MSLGVSESESGVVGGLERTDFFFFSKLISSAGGNQNEDVLRVYVE